MLSGHAPPREPSSASLRRATARLALALLLFLPPAASALTLTFDELSEQPADGVVVSGVTFDFKVGGTDSTDATYGDPGFGTLTYVDGRVLEGDVAGTLTLDLASFSPTIEFGVALNTIGTVSPGFTVELFDAGLVSLGVFDVETQSLVGFSEGQFTYAGDLVRRVSVDFDDSFSALDRRFALDNFSFSPVPEPATASMLAVGLCLLGLYRRRRRRR